MATHTPRFNLSQPENTDEMTSFMSDYANNMNIIDENLGGGGGSANIVELTQAEYDALPDSKLSDDTMYLIKDLNSASDAEFTHVNGFFVDTNNVIASGTYVGSFSYTATQDCYFYGSIANSQDNSASITIDGVPVYEIYDSTVSQSGVVLPLKKGQVIALSTTFSQAATSYKIYGVQAGSNVTIIPDYASACYSTQEREVGCWIDGKPLYQRSFFFNNQVITDNAWMYNILGGNLTGIEIKDYEGYFGLENTDFVATFDYFRNNDGGFNEYFTAYSTGTDINVRPNMNAGVNVILMYCTIWYTKTADVAGSGQWTPMAQPTHHYSTTEQVVGTWVDGKPLYERSFSHINTQSTFNDFVTIDSIANVDVIASLNGIAHRQIDTFDGWIDISSRPEAQTNYSIAMRFANGNLQYRIDTYGTQITDIYITVRYTKTTD